MRSVGLLVICLFGCGGREDGEEAPVEPVARAETMSPGPAEMMQSSPDPLAGLDDIEALEAERPEVGSIATVSDATARAAVPDDGCTLLSSEPRRVWPTPGFADLVALGEAGFVVVGYARPDSGSGEDLFAAIVPLEGPPRPLLREAIERPLRTVRAAPPGVARIDDGTVAIAITDLRARVRYTTLHVGGRRASWVDVGEQVDQRFAPAISVAPGYVGVSYVDAGAPERMVLRFVRLDPTGRIIGRHDLTPPSMGGTAPYAVGDRVFFIDAHVGQSVALEVELDTVVAPKGDARVIRPISHLFDPAALAPVRVGRRWLVGYTAVGTGATTAVGLVWAEGTQTPSPEPIVAGAGYGRLHVDAVPAGSRAIFVADAPKGRDREAPRELRLRVAVPEPSRVRLGEPLTLAGPEGNAHLGRVDRHRSGIVGVAFSTDDAIYLYAARCDES